MRSKLKTRCKLVNYFLFECIRILICSIYKIVIIVCLIKIIILYYIILIYDIIPKGLNKWYT